MCLVDEGDNRDASVQRLLSELIIDGRTDALVGKDLRGASFDGRMLNNTDFSGARLDSAGFERTELVDCVFEGANLKNANFTNADLRGADLSQAIDLAAATLKGALYDKYTGFPDRFDPASKEMRSFEPNEELRRALMTAGEAWLNPSIAAREALSAAPLKSRSSGVTVSSGLPGVPASLAFIEESVLKVKTGENASGDDRQLLLAVENLRSPSEPKLVFVIERRGGELARAVVLGTTRDSASYNDKRAEHEIKFEPLRGEREIFTLISPLQGYLCKREGPDELKTVPVIFLNIHSSHPWQQRDMKVVKIELPEPDSPSTRDVGRLQS